MNSVAVLIIPVIPAVIACLYALYDGIRYTLMMERKNEEKHSGKNP